MSVLKQLSAVARMTICVAALLVAGCVGHSETPEWYKQKHSQKPGSAAAHGLAGEGTVTELAAETTPTALADAATPTVMLDPEATPVPPAPFSEGIFPCSECHKDEDVDETPRKLEDEHDNIHLVHGNRDRWCFDCHNPTDRDKLRLAGGRLIDFSVSYQLCGQCHGPKLRDWRAGVHGKRTGNWNGAKQYLLCVHCHDPHAPRFAPLKPEPIPKRPSEIMQ